MSSLTSPAEPVPSLSSTWSLGAIVNSSPEPPHHRSRPWSSPFTRRHLPWPELVMLPTTLAPSSSPRCHPEPTTMFSSLSLWCSAPSVIPEPATTLTLAILEPAAPSSSLSPWCPRSRDAVEPAPSLSLAMPPASPSPQGYNIVYFSLSFWAYKSWFWYATLPHCFDMLHIATLLWYATFSSIWMHTTLLNDESGLSETSVATWTNIIVLLRFQLRTTCNK
jgi:hypothetical protein